jgi:mannose/fructose-specific phosphotransferase system component IIA
VSATGVVVITHGNSASCMVEAAERVVGTLNVRTIAVRIGEPRTETESHIESVVGELDTEEVLFLTDLEGSTPYNLCCKKCGGKSVVLSGMNLPMLFKLATADRQHGALLLAEELRATGMKSIHIRTASGLRG